MPSYANYLRLQPGMVSPIGTRIVAARTVRLRGLGDSSSGDPGTTMATTDTGASSLPSTSQPPSLQRLTSPVSGYYPLFWVLSAASTGLSAYHGYRRNDSVGWAIWWGLMGTLFPVVSVAIAVAQGFGKRAR
jgi:hypothetical protein